MSLKHGFQHRSHASGRAVTLIELLVVIAVVGVLAAILIPVVGKVRSSARMAQSSSSLRELHRATITLADQNRGRFPNADVLLAKPAPYTYYTIWDSVNGLPSVLYPEKARAWFTSRTTVFAQNSFWDGTVFQSPSLEQGGVARISYAPNGRIFNTVWNARPFFMEHYNPSLTILYGDAFQTNQLIWQTPPKARGALNARNGASGEFKSDGRALVVYLDGHVGTLSAADADEFSLGTTTKARRAWGIE